MVKEDIVKLEAEGVGDISRRVLQLVRTPQGKTYENNKEK